MTLTTVNPALLDTQAQYTGFKNRLFNGNMSIDQRNAGASITPTASVYTLDRWRLGASVASKVSVQRSTVAPEGFANSTLITSLSAYTMTGTEEINFGQRIEGFNTADFGWGTANAKPVTLSFLVRSSLTGLFSGAIKNVDSNRAYAFSYTISAANTWEQKSITISGDTTGTWNTDSSIGLIAQFCIAAAANLNAAGVWYGTNTIGVTGTTQLVGTSGATFYITGVQLEKGSTATSFDYRPYGTELALCQRYFWRSNTSNLDGIGGFFGSFYNTTTFSATVKWPVSMRAAPTIVRGGTRDNFYVPGISATTSATTATPQITVDGAWSEFSGSSPTAGLGYASGYNGQLSVSAEL